MLCAGDGVLGEPAVDGVAAVVLLLAQRLAAVDAVAALAAGVSEPGDRDAFSDRPVGDARAELLDDADSFVAGHERQAGLDGPVAVGGVDVGVTQTARLQVDQHLTGCRLGDLTLLDLERSAER